MYFVFSSSNPETIELFRATYYKPKLGLWFLLFILFPPIDRSTISNQTVSDQLTTTTTTTATATTTTINTLPITDTLPTSHSSCPDAYRDHRNNLICPHAPKRLKSVRQRFSQVLLEFKISILRLISSQDHHQQLDLQLEQPPLQNHHHHHQQQQQQLHPSHPLSSLPQLILCTPLANPFLHLIILLHILLIIQALSLLIEDALIKDACFSGPTNSFRRSTSWLKLWSRFRFRLRKQWSQPAFLEPFSLWLVCLGIVALITSETLAEPGSWTVGQPWHDLPFRNRCGWSSDKEYDSLGQVSIISAAPVLRLLGFLLNRAPFLKPARALILIECLLSFVSLLQPAQHILPSRILPKLIRVPDWILKLRHKKLRQKLHCSSIHPHHLHHTHQQQQQQYHYETYLHQNSLFQDHSLLAAAVASSCSDHHHHQHPLHQQQHLPGPIVEVETKWLLGVLVEGCIGLSSIIAYLIVMVHLPYASHYSIPFFLSIYSIKSFSRQIARLLRTSLNTLDCLQLVLYEFSGPRRGLSRAASGKSGRTGDAATEELPEEEEAEEEQDWTCSICFEETADSGQAEPSSSPPSSSSSSSGSSSSSSDSPSSLHHPHRRTPKRHQPDPNLLLNRCVLNCGHAYHTSCLVKWLHYQAFCPVCHRPVL